MTEKKIPGQVSGGERAIDEDERPKRDAIHESGIERMDGEGGAQNPPPSRDWVPGDVKMGKREKKAIDENEPEP